MYVYIYRRSGHVMYFIRESFLIEKKKKITFRRVILTSRYSFLQLNSIVGQ